ncbi:hypothetical protein [Ornithinibacillus bavariensis]|nr:hypothetical protein [Ornithinibacillus bavariensis]
MICEENVERTHDENERQAMYAIMYAAASRGKGKHGKLPKPDELYRRPTEEDMTKTKVKSVLEKQVRAQEWLGQFDLTKLTGKEVDAK